MMDCGHGYDQLVDDPQNPGKTYCKKCREAAGRESYIGRAIRMHDSWNDHRRKDLESAGEDLMAAVATLLLDVPRLKDTRPDLVKAHDRMADVLRRE